MRQVPKFRITSQSVVWFAGLLCIGIGLAVLVGWHWKIQGLKSVFPGAVAMMVNSAFGIICTGAALMLQTRPDRRANRLAFRILALAVLALGLLTLVEYLFTVDFGIDQLVYQDTNQAFNAFRGRMSPLTAWSLTLLGISLNFLNSKKIPWVHFLCAPQVFLIGFISVLGYLWDANEIITDAFIPPVAVHTGFALMVLAVGVLAARFGKGGRPSANDFKMTAVELKLILGLGVVFLVVAGSFGYTYRASQKLSIAYQWVEHTQEVRLVLTDLQAKLKDAETNLNFFYLTGDAKYRDPLQNITGELNQDLGKLAKLIADNPQQLERLAATQTQIKTSLQNLEKALVFEGRKTKSQQDELALHDKDLMRFDDIQMKLIAMDDVERSLLVERKITGEQDRTTMLVSLLISLGFTAFIFLALVLAMRTEIFHRTRSEAASKEFSDRLQRAVDDRTAELQTANQRLNRFTYSLAHDLRQPLISSTGFISLMMRDKSSVDDPKVRHYLQRISSAVVQMNRITESILEIARISRLQAHRKLVDVSGLVTEIVQACAEKEPERIVKVSIQPNMQLVCDQNLLRMALTLLIDNAWKFTHDVDSAAIDIGQDNLGDERTLWVKDNGVGFDMAYRDKLFMPFSRLHSNEQFSGLGVGLAYVDAAIFRNLATVAIQSEVGKGTTVSIKFSNQGVMSKPEALADLRQNLQEVDGA